MRLGVPFVVAFCCFVAVAIAQTPTLDSLKSSVRNTDDIKTRVHLLSELASEWQMLEIDSAFHYAIEAYTLASGQSDPGTKALAAATVAYVYVTANDLDEARKYYAEAAAQHLSSGNLLESTRCQMLLGNIALAKGGYFEALQYYEACLLEANEHRLTELLPHLNNNIGVIFLELGDNDQALPYLNDAARQFEETGDEYSATYAALNIAYIYHQQGEDEKALDNYISIVPRHLKNERWTDLASVYNSIASIHKDAGNVDKAEEYNGLALDIIENNKSNFLGPSSKVESKIYLTAAEIAVLSEEPLSAVAYARNALRLALPNAYKAYILQNARLLTDVYFALGIQDSALYYSRLYLEQADLMDDGQGIAEVTKLRLQNDFASKLQEAELESLKRNVKLKQRETIYIASVAVTLMLVALLTLLYLNQKKKISEARLRRKNLELEQEKLVQQVEYKNKELALNMMYLAEKSEFISQIGHELESLKSDAKRENRQLIQQVINQLKKNSDANAWDEFEMRFKEVHEEFYESLNAAYPGLTPNEKRLCAFLRMNMTTKEISALTHQSLNSINMARFRLRKKMDMDQDDNLITFLTNL